MSLKFAANLNFLFTETTNSIAQRIHLAQLHGFRAVEIPYPENETNEVLLALKQTGLVVSLMNLAFDSSSDKLRYGSTSIPGAEDLFLLHLTQTIEFALKVNCTKIHLTAGIITEHTETDHVSTYLDNLKLAAARLKAHNLMGVIEPINKYAIPNYFMNSYAKAKCILEELSCDNIKILADLYHLQHIHGNITKILSECQTWIGHFQIAQVPNRQEPNTAGELDYGYVFKLVENFGYTDWIGCEYRPKTTTVEGLKWIGEMGYKF